MPSQFNTGDGLAPVEFPTGVWVAYYSDRSGIYPYADEVSALRAAVDKCAQVKFVPFGEEVFDHAAPPALLPDPSAPPSSRALLGR